jgi:hypothetical protein
MEEASSLRVVMGWVHEIQEWVWCFFSCDFEVGYLQILCVSKQDVFTTSDGPESDNILPLYCFVGVVVFIRNTLIVSQQVQSHSSQWPLFRALSLNSVPHILCGSPQPFLPCAITSTVRPLFSIRLFLQLLVISFLHCFYI